MVGWRSGVHCPRRGSVGVKGHGNHGQGLKRYPCKDCGRTLNDKTETPFQYSRPSLRERFTLILSLLPQSSFLSPGWLLGRSHTTVLKALRRLRMGGELRPVRDEWGCRVRRGLRDRGFQGGTTAGASDGLTVSLGVGA